MIQAVPLEAHALHPEVKPKAQLVLRWCSRAQHNDRYDRYGWLTNGATTLSSQLYGAAIATKLAIGTAPNVINIADFIREFPPLLTWIAFLHDSIVKMK